MVQIIEGTQGDCSFQNKNSSVLSINCAINAHLQRFSAYGLSNDIVLKLIQSLPMNKTSGLDGNYAKLFKEKGPTSFTYIIIRSLTTGIFPNDWKEARVTPIYKDDIKSNPSNYSSYLSCRLSILMTFLLRI